MASSLPAFHMTCPICKKPYDKDVRQPKMCLPCDHTYCKACLENLLKCAVPDVIGEKRIKCPDRKCGCVIWLPKGTIDSLPTNVDVESERNYYDIRKEFEQHFASAR